MRLIYFIVKLIVPYSISVYFPRKKTVNQPKEFFGRTIYVSNHAAAFMDPFVVGSLQNPIVFFMTRSDVFNKFTSPILYLTQMLPIYRQHDGGDTSDKNKKVFKECARILKSGRNLLIYGEGFTDDVFVRRLKPIKKGAVRIGFSALEDIDWSKKIYLKTVGINYGNPNYTRNDLLIINGDKICLNDYKTDFLENPNRVIAELTKQVEYDLRELVVHVEDYDWAFFLEDVSRLKRAGMHPEDTNFDIPLQDRWNNLKQFSLWLNAQKLNENTELVELKNDISTYFKEVKRKKILAKHVFEYDQDKTGFRGNEFLFLATVWPLAIIGLIHCFVPYILTKRFVEKSFKRRVFWGSVKMVLGTLTIGLWNIPIAILLNNLVFHNTWISLVYYILSPSIGLAAYLYARKLKDRKMKKSVSNTVFEDLNNKRIALIERIDAALPVQKWKL